MRNNMSESRFCFRAEIFNKKKGSEILWTCIKKEK